MSIPMKPVRIGIALMALLFGCCAQPALAASGTRLAGQAADEQVTLTVTSTCGPASIRLKRHNVQTTPFGVTFPRGKTIQLKALDASLPQCGTLAVASPFKQFIVNQVMMPEGERSIALTLDRDTAVLIQYGAAASPPVTLSVAAGCYRGAYIKVTETAAGGQSGTFRTHFDANFLQGQSLRLEAPPVEGMCTDLGIAFLFSNWSAGGKVYPQNQTVIDLPLTGFTNAYAHYSELMPALRINSYQLLHNGVQADYVRVGEDLGEFTFHLSGEPFPAEITVFVDGLQQAQILSRPSPGEIEIRLPARRTDTPGFSLVLVTSPDSRFSNAVQIEIRKE